VTSRQDTACAEEKAVNQMVVAKNAVARQKRCIAIAPKIVYWRLPKYGLDHKAPRSGFGTTRTLAHIHVRVAMLCPRHQSRWG